MRAVVLACTLLIACGREPEPQAPTAPPVDAHGAQQAVYRAKFEEKLRQDFVAFGGWMSDYGRARARAEAEDKLLFLYFTRSYAP